MGFSHPLWHPTRLRGTGHDHPLVYEACRRTQTASVTARLSERQRSEAPGSICSSEPVKQTDVARAREAGVEEHRQSTAREAGETRITESKRSDGGCLARRKVSSCGERRTRRLEV